MQRNANLAQDFEHAGIGPAIVPAPLTPEGMDMVSRRTLLGLGIAGAGAVAAGMVADAAFSAAMATAQAACDPNLSRIAPSRHGDVEFADVGTGTPLLMVHGTGGGFDQGLLFARPLIEMGYRLISPSRFGYLRSSFPAEPGSANQADAYADLLDHLGIERIAVSGGSAGALSAIEFAVRHPDRCAALLPIVPATYAPDPNAVTSDAPPPGVDIAMALLRSDFLFWTGLNLLPDAMTGTLLATNPDLLKVVDATEQQRARDILWGLLPVSRRADGLINDAKLAGHPVRSALESITAPTLTISTEDDRFGTAKAARHIAASVPGAKSIIYPTGGHIWLGHDRELFAAIDAFLKEIGYQ